MEAPSQGLQTVMNWKTVLVIFVVVLVYLVSGGLVFHSLEQPFESMQKNTIALEKADFLRKHTCVNEIELETLIQHAVDADNAGVSPVGPSSNTSSHWDLGGAFFFAGTVITTIGLPNHGQTRQMGPSRNLLLNGKSYPTKVRLIRGGSMPPVKRRRMNWIDAPDDVFYMATEETRKIRKLLSSSEAKRAARRPYKPIILRPIQTVQLRQPMNDEPIIIED